MGRQLNAKKSRSQVKQLLRNVSYSDAVSHRSVQRKTLISTERREERAHMHTNTAHCPLLLQSEHVWVPYGKIGDNGSCGRIVKREDSEERT